MHKIILAAAAALAIVSAPALAQSTDCPEGTTTSNPDGGPVTCDNADSSTADNPTTPAEGDNPLDASQAGEGVQDALSGDGAGNNNNNNN